MKTILKPTLRAFTLLEMMIAMTLTGLLVLFGHEIMQTFDKSSQSYQANMLKSLDLSRIVSQTANDFWHAWDIKSGVAGEELVFVLNDGQGVPLVHYLMSDSALVRMEGTRKDTFTNIWAGGENKDVMTLPDSGASFFQMFLVPERSLAIKK